MDSAILTEGQIRYRKYKDTYAKYRDKHKYKKRLWKQANKDLVSVYMQRWRFGREREKILQCGSYKCFQCGMSNDKHIERWGRSLTIDHIDGQGRYSKVKNNDLDNLMILCLSCHGKKDRTRRCKTYRSEVGG